MTRLRSLCALAATASLVVVPTAAHASNNLYLEADGLQGEATATHYENQIEVFSFSWGASRAKFAKQASFSDFNFIKRFDQASPTILQDVASGKTVSSAKLHVVRASGSAPFEFLTICFTGVQFTADQLSGSQGGDDRPTESVSMNYQTVVERYAQQNADGSPGTPIFGGWDLVRNIQFGGPSSC